MFETARAAVPALVLTLAVACGDGPATPAAPAPSPVPPAALPIDPQNPPNIRWHALTALSTIPNYYVGRVITFTIPYRL